MARPSKTTKCDYIRVLSLIIINPPLTFLLHLIPLHLAIPVLTAERNSTIFSPFTLKKSSFFSYFFFYQAIFKCLSQFSFGVNSKRNLYNMSCRNNNNKKIPCFAANAERDWDGNLIFKFSLPPSAGHCSEDVNCEDCGQCRVNLKEEGSKSI